MLDGQTSQQIAKHFHVSRELVEYRLKVTRLWRTIPSAQHTVNQVGQCMAVSMCFWLAGRMPSYIALVHIISFSLAMSHRTLNMSLEFSEFK